MDHVCYDFRGKGGTKHHWVGIHNLPILNITLNSTLVLQHKTIGMSFRCLLPRAMGRVLYLVWYDLSLIFTMGRAHSSIG